MPDQINPPQEQHRQPGVEADMMPEPRHQAPEYAGSGKLKGTVALITGRDSGIGRATAVLFAREGADVAVVYLDEHSDALQTKQLVEKQGRRCVTIAGDVGDESFCQSVVQQMVDELGRLLHAGQQRRGAASEGVHRRHLG